MLFYIFFAVVMVTLILYAVSKLCKSEKNPTPLESEVQAGEREFFEQAHKNAQDLDKGEK